MLKDGHHVATRPTDGGGNHDDLVRLMVGREASAFFIKEAVEIGDVAHASRGLHWGRASGSRFRSRVRQVRCWALEVSSARGGPS